MYQFIVNPHSRSGRGQVIWKEIEPVLIGRKITYQVYFTRYQKHATQIVREITEDLSEHTLVALGGDGTVNEVVNGICDFDKVTLGYIPTGSSNDFARGFKLPCEPLKALENILTPVSMTKMDVGVLSYQNKKRHFAVSTGIGFDAAVCHQAVVSPLKAFLNRLHLGKLTYACIAVNRILTSSTAKITVTMDNESPAVFEKAYFAAIMNHPYEGGGFKFCPKARTDDGKLDVIVISGISKLMILILLPTAFWGLHRLSRKVHILKGESAAIRSDRALPVHTDGEPIFLQKDISAVLAHSKLRVIT